MLDQKDLQAISDLILAGHERLLNEMDQKMDRRFAEFEAKMDQKMDEKLDRRFAEFEAKMDQKMDEKLDQRFAVFEEKLDQKFGQRIKQQIAASEKRMRRYISKCIHASESMVLDEIEMCDKRNEKRFQGLEKRLDRLERDYRMFQGEHETLDLLARLTNNHERRILTLEQAFV